MSHHGFQSPRPDDLPLAANVWDAARSFGRGSETAQVALYDALVALEAEVIELRGRL